MVHDYHMKQYETMFECTRGLLEFMDECVGEMGERRIADVACGAGANIVHMLRRWPQSRVSGYTLEEHEVEFARAHLPVDLADRCDGYVPMDFFQIQEKVAADTVDIATIMQTIFFWPPDEAEAILQSLMHMSSDWVFISGLFDRHNMDVTMKIRDHAKNCDVQYCIFDIPKWEERCKRLGAVEVVMKHFEIGIDLEAPMEGGTGSWTQKTDDGRRLQFSGAVPLPWYFCGIRLK
jgi:trans-aconitate methyltransferase